MKQSKLEIVFTNDKVGVNITVGSGLSKSISGIFKTRETLLEFVSKNIPDSVFEPVDVNAVKLAQLESELEKIRIQLKNAIES